MTGTAGQKRIPSSFLQEYKIPMPSLELQEKIVKTLRRAEQLLEKREQANQLANKIIQSVFLKMFGNPLTNLMGWQSKSLGSLMQSKLLHGKSLVRTRVNLGGEGIPVLKVGALTDFALDPSEHKYYNDKSVEQRYLLKEDDILISRSNTIELVGRSGRYTGKPDPCIFPDLMIRLRPNRQVLEPIYLESYLKTDFVRNFFRGRARGTSGSMPKISNTDIEDVQIMIPPLVIQRRFVEAVRKGQSLKTIQEDSTHKINRLFDSVMYKAFNGELKFN